jgi:hypothetical protein
VLLCFITLEVTLANRAMNAKLLRARKQAREAAHIEFTKPAYILQTPKRELREMVSGFDGVMVRKLSSLRVPDRRCRTYGDGARRGSILTADVYAVETRLIRHCRGASHA